MRNYSVDELHSASWQAKFTHDFVTELEAYTGEKWSCIEEMRRFLALKGCRELLERLQEARRSKTSYNALKSVAHALRQYALDRPTLCAATFRTPSQNSPEWRTIYQDIRQLMIGLFAECGLSGRAGEHAFWILRSLVRGLVLQEIAGCSSDVHFCQEAYEMAIEIFIAGLPVLSLDFQNR